MMQKIRATISFTKETQYISTKASTEGKELIIILSCYSVKWGQMEGKRKLRKFNEFNFPFYFPVAKLSGQMESEESNNPNLNPKITLILTSEMLSQYL